MGYVIASKCSKCNFNNTFRFGGGRFNHLTHFPIPVINKESGLFETINHYDNPNPDFYLYYHKDELKTNKENQDKIEFNSLYLNWDNNFCPECQEFSLHFRIKLLTD